MLKGSTGVAIIYIAAGVAWILWSDHFFADAPQIIQSYKGIGYVLFTGLLLWLFMRRTEARNREMLNNLEKEVGRASEATRKSVTKRNLLRTVIDNLPDYIYAKDTQGKLLVRNAALKQYSKIYSSEELESNEHPAFLNSTIHQEQFSNDELAVLASETPLFNKEEVIRDENGKARWLLTTLVPLLDPNSKVTGIVGISRDVTALQNKREIDELVVRIVEALGSNELLEDALVHTLEIIGTHFDFELAEAWFASPEKDKVQLAATWAQRNDSTFHLNHKHEFTPGEGLPGKAFESGQVEIWRDITNHPGFTRKDRAEKEDMHTGIGIPLLLSGRSIGVFTFLSKRSFSNHQELKDILEQISIQIVLHLERKRHEKELEQNNARISTILESISDGFFAVSENWTVTFWNSEAERVLKTPRGEIVGKKLFDFFPDDGESRHITYGHYQRVMDEKKPVVFENFNESLQVWLEISVYPSGNGISVFFRNVTENRNLREELNNRIEELANSNAELEQFAYIASHDMQEPLRMVTGFLSQLEKKYTDLLDERGKQYIHFAVDGATRMRKLILDLLEYSKVGKADVGPERFSVKEMIADIIQLNQMTINEEGAVITFDDFPEITAAKTLVQQVFHNLIMNAIKYRQEDQAPVIHIGSHTEKRHWKFWVSDNGIGVSPDYFDKIFVIFQRLHNKEQYSGTGIGLSICKKIVENHGGRIWIESEEGKGSTFYFTIKK
ncbi:MAG TPA: ATP-binding protein [Flavobacterium sp.]|jgi:PAS domain S-box-containing protein